MNRNIASRIEREIIQLCESGLDSRALRVETVRQLRKVIPIDSFWFATVDPATLLFTGSVVEEIPELATSAFVANEFLRDDVNKWVQLAHSHQPANGLYLATQGQLCNSPRYQEILTPLGFGDELRAVMRDGEASWGFVCLHRERSSSNFTAEEAEFVARLTPHIAEGLRSGLLIARQAARADDNQPGLIVLADDLSVVATTPAAERWLSELADWPRRSELPQAVYGVVSRLRALELSASGESDSSLPPPPRARVRTPAGQWLVLHASRLSGSGMSNQTAVILEPARAAEIAPVMLQAYGLTRREGQIAQLVLQGASTNAISSQLFISPLTVQQHLKMVFDKTGVRSRRDLVALIFSEQYQPRIKAGLKLSVDGWFAPSGT